MAANYLQNRTGAKQVTIRVVANSTVQPTDLQYPDANTEIVTGFTIASLFWSTENVITIARGANTILNLTGNGMMPLNYYGISLNEYPTANLVVTINDVTTSLIMDLHKIPYVHSGYFGDVN